MGLEQASVCEIVEKAVGHKWSIPEFQRGFVWTPQKVRDLIDSLWRGYPVGSFLIWYGGEYEEPRTIEDAQTPAAWVVDGQQRTTALCVLFGRKPFWWAGDWNGVLEKHDVRYHVLAREEPFFSLRTAAMKGLAARPWVPVRDVLNADDEKLSGIVDGLLKGLDLRSNMFGQLYTRLERVRQIGRVPIPVVTVMLDLEDVTEIFARLNSAGTKVTEADIALALAASQNPGWARTTFLPFLHELDEAGFALDPNLVFRSCVGIGLRRARLKEVPSSYWKSRDMLDAWARAEKAWRSVIQYVEGHGILSTEILPTKNALIPLAILTDRFPEVFETARPFAWLLHATRAGRYGGSALTALEADLQAIDGAMSGDDAVGALQSKLTAWEPLTAQDFFQDYRDRVLRLLLYLIMYDRGARDWGPARQRLGFHGTELLERFNPDWHHIFPRAYLRRSGKPEHEWDMFANIAVIAPSTNLRFGARNPMSYLDRYGVDNALLAEQLVPTDRRLLTLERYSEFLNLRAGALADAANRYVDKLLGVRDGAAAPD